MCLTTFVNDRSARAVHGKTETKGRNCVITHGRYLELKRYISSKLSTELYADWKFR